ncbi:PAS domain S-box protein [Haloferax namakaokahaiae]|uniref:histidine kinase n=1 Tax=Haloferax namakaokahaiae TaxID=1748331 RepID=A0ABD5ZC36_9EURY
MVLDEIRVLHLDDDPAFAELTATFLEREDAVLDVEAVSTATEGLERLQDEVFHCIVSDYEMPDTDGIEFLKGVRQSFPSIPFILFTGKGSEEVASKAITAGVTDYLQKDSGTSQYEILANRIVNVVEQYRATQRAAETERQLQLLAENTNDILWMFTGDWSELLFINSPYQEVWGREISELYANSESFMEGIHPNDRDKVREAMARLASGEPTDTEYRVNAEEEFSRRVWVQGQPVFDEDGEVRRIVGFARDITEMRADKRRLERYETMVEASGDPIYTLDKFGRFTSVNTAFVELMGYDEESILGSHVSKVMGVNNVEEGERLVKHLLSSDAEHGKFELALETASGDEVLCENHMSLLPFEEEFRGTAGVLRDITDRVSRVENLRNERDLLDEFASVVSHDLQSPLAVATGHLELAMESYECDHLHAVERAHDRISILIDDLLTLARNGNEIGSRERIELADVVERTWNNVAREDADIDVSTERIVEADFTRLQQLFENLFRNAIQHGGDEVTITVSDTDHGFCVADDGTGIPEGDRENLFDAGYTTSTEGTGLGLSIVREIASAHGWSIDVSASVNGGARFEFSGC